MSRLLLSETSSSHKSVLSSSSRHFHSWYIIKIIFIMRIVGLYFSFTESVGKPFTTCTTFLIHFLYISEAFWFFRIRRKTLYYMYNIVFPCMMMSTLTVQKILREKCEIIHDYIHRYCAEKPDICILKSYISRCSYSADIFFALIYFQVLVFCMPPDSGEKIALGVTVTFSTNIYLHPHSLILTLIGQVCVKIFLHL